MTRYHPALVVLHWLLAILIIGALIMGSQVLAETPNDDPSKLTSLMLHMIIGITILVLMTIRVITKLMTAKPPHADTGNAVLNRAGVWTHWAFYALVFVMGASGIAISIQAGLPAIVFGGSGDPLPVSFGEFTPRRVHGIVSKLLALLILAHVVAGIYHQVILRDGLFARMWFGARNPR